MGHTHATLGAVSGLLVATIVHAPAPEGVALAIIGAVVALLPDIDHPGGTLRGRLGIVGNLAFFWLSHRGLTHTLFALGATVVLGLMSHWPEPVLFTVALAYGSHLLADIITRGGLPLLWPLTDHIYHLPPSIETGGWVESFLWIVFLGASLALYARL